MNLFSSKRPKNNNKKLRNKIYYFQGIICIIIISIRHMKIDNKSKIQINYVVEIWEGFKCF